jgi:hypothetical protein
MERNIKLKTLLVLTLTTVLLACSPQQDDTAFPVTTTKTVEITLEPHPVVSQKCAAVIGMSSEQAYITPPRACAVWSKNKCHIIVGETVTHKDLGHEVRHCFFGHFHK